MAPVKHSNAAAAAPHYSPFRQRRAWAGPSPGCFCCALVLLALSVWLPAAMALLSASPETGLDRVSRCVPWAGQRSGRLLAIRLLPGCSAPPSLYLIGSGPPVGLGSLTLAVGETELPGSLFRAAFYTAGMLVLRSVGVDRLPPGSMPRTA